MAASSLAGPLQNDEKVGARGYTDYPFSEEVPKSGEVQLKAQEIFTLG
jgi:hypothetical protein